MMSISTISSTPASAVGSQSDSSQLDKQIQVLQKKITEENASKTDDAKTKQQKVLLLQQQIDQLEAQIQQQAQTGRNNVSHAKPSVESAVSSGALLDTKA